jgi:enoyl-CoA hydratase/carnithine racemase
MSDSHILFRLDDQTAILTINREQQRNALSAEAIDLLHAHLDRIQGDTAVRVVLLTGAGEKAFCTGADLGGGAMPTDGAHTPAAFQEYARLLKRIYSFPKPTVAKVRGFCLAGGMGLMMACDIVLAEETSRFGTPEVNVGLFPMMIGALIFRNVLRKKAMEMVLSGRMLDAAEAESLGLITRSVPADQLDGAVAQIVQSLCAKSPIGLRIGKEAFYTMADMPFGQAVDYLADQLFAVARTQDAKEGLRAFMEKRKPAFTGK